MRTPGTLRTALLLALLVALPFGAQAQKRIKTENLPNFDLATFHFGFLLSYNTADFFVERKPFDPAEVWQVVRSLVQKRSSEATARTATLALETLNQRLRHEIDARKSAEGKLLFDPLTELPNRVLLNNQIAACIDRFRRDSSRGYALVFVDLDRFKEINDSLGHDTGDALLIEVSRILSKMVRLVDLTGRDCDLAARLGGDEFVLLLDGVNTADDVRKVTTRIVTALHEPIAVGGQSIRAEMSMGFVLGTTEHSTPDDVLRDADAALYHAKKHGRGLVCEFNDSIREKVLTRRRLSKELRQAVATETDVTPAASGTTPAT
jgi:diguanylate cyclase (GGDEF)-like protein